MEETEHTPDNPYTALEGYGVYDARGERIGEVEATIYDAPSNVLKYLAVNGRTVPADRMEVDAERERVTLPYEGEIIASAPELREPSGEFDAAVREHYGGP
jgi:sporulation protein YlmC with PRC-barrel domain